jgi:hypothetical protein
MVMPVTEKQALELVAVEADRRLQMGVQFVVYKDVVLSVSSSREDTRTAWLRLKDGTTFLVTIEKMSRTPEEYQSVRKDALSEHRSDTTIFRQ